MGLTKKQIEKAVEIAKSYGVKKLLIFGSALDDPANANDLDLACDGIEDSKFFEFAGFLEEVLNITVDLVPLNPPNSFTEYIKTHGNYLI